MNVQVNDLQVGSMVSEKDAPIGEGTCVVAGFDETFPDTVKLVNACETTFGELNGTFKYVDNEVIELNYQLV